MYTKWAWNVDIIEQISHCLTYIHTVTTWYSLSLMISYRTVLKYLINNLTFEIMVYFVDIWYDNEVDIV